LREAKSEIENFGPNPAVLGDAGISARSGRAIQLLQQAGIAELGPFMTNLRSWKIRLYTALFNAARQYWTQERWIRVTDKNGQQQFVGINVPTTDQMGMPTIQNAIGELDVDIILDEGPDSVTIMQDTYDAISQALPAIAPMLPPGGGQAVMEILVETSPLPQEVKDRFKAAAQATQGQPDPKTAAAQQKMQIDAQAKQQDAQLEAFKAQQKAQLQRAQAIQEGIIEQEKAQNEINIARFKAMSQAEIAREKALAGPQMRLPF
jgi:regulator of protease activity HflC (stomatin/prohibitin superfamily)